VVGPQEVGMEVGEDVDGLAVVGASVGLLVKGCAEVGW